MYTDFIYQQVLADAGLSALLPASAVFVGEADRDTNSTYLVIAHDVTAHDGRSWGVDLRAHSVTFTVYSKDPTELGLIVKSVRSFVYGLGGTVESERETDKVTDFFGLSVYALIHKES